MLEVGNGNLTEAETRSHFALWAIMKSPLIIGTDLSNITQTNIDILQNKYLLAFNQDPVYGKPAQPYKWGVNPDWTFNATHPVRVCISYKLSLSIYPFFLHRTTTDSQLQAEYWSGSFMNGTLVAMLNTLDGTRHMTVDFSDIPQLTANGKYKVTNAWTGESMGCKHGKVSMKVKEHDTAVLILEDNC
jgi:alpha-galactosidase